MENIKYDMVIIGHMSKDIVIIDGKTEVCSGGSAYYAAFPPKYLKVNFLVITKLHWKIITFSRISGKMQYLSFLLQINILQ